MPQRTLYGYPFDVRKVMLVEEPDLLNDVLLSDLADDYVVVLAWGSWSRFDFACYQAIPRKLWDDPEFEYDSYVEATAAVEQWIEGLIRSLPTEALMDTAKSLPALLKEYHPYAVSAPNNQGETTDEEDQQMAGQY